MRIAMRFHAFHDSTRNPLGPRPFDFRPAFYKSLFHGRQTGLQAKHAKLSVKRFDPHDEFIKIVATAESHWDDNRTRSEEAEQPDACDCGPAPQDDVLVVVRSRPFQFDPLWEASQNEPGPFRIIDCAPWKRIA